MFAFYNFYSGVNTATEQKYGNVSGIVYPYYPMKMMSCTAFEQKNHFLVFFLPKVGIHIDKESYNIACDRRYSLPDFEADVLTHNAIDVIFVSTLAEISKPISKITLGNFLTCIRSPFWDSYESPTYLTRTELYVARRYITVDTISYTERQIQRSLSAVLKTFETSLPSFLNLYCLQVNSKWYLLFRINYCYRNTEDRSFCRALDVISSDLKTNKYIL